MREKAFIILEIRQSSVEEIRIRYYLDVHLSHAADPAWSGRLSCGAKFKTDKSVSRSSLTLLPSLAPSRRARGLRSLSHVTTYLLGTRK